MTFIIIYLAIAVAYYFTISDLRVQAGINKLPKDQSEFLRGNPKAVVIAKMIACIFWPLAVIRDMIEVHGQIK